MKPYNTDLDSFSQETDETDSFLSNLPNLSII